MSPSKNRGREAAHRRAAAQAAAREASKRRQRRMRAAVAGVMAIVVVLAVVLATFPNSGHGSSSSTSSTTSTTVTKPIKDAVIKDSADATTTPAFTYGTGACPPDTKPATKPTSFAQAPQKCIKDGVDYKAKVVTSEGAFTIDLFEHRSPGTVNNFVVLAKWGWFDGQPFGRVVPDFVNQEGEPSGKGPGYTIPDELPAAVQSYARWAIAMANRGPKTGADAWFTCIDCSKLPTPGYSLFGQITDGTDVAQAINNLGTGDGPPSKPVAIESVTILES